MLLSNQSPQWNYDFAFVATLLLKCQTFQQQEDLLWRIQHDSNVRFTTSYDTSRAGNGKEDSAEAYATMSFA